MFSVIYLSQRLQINRSLALGIGDHVPLRHIACDGVGDANAYAFGRRDLSKEARSSVLVFGDLEAHKLPRWVLRWSGIRLFHNIDPHQFFGDHLLLAQLAHHVFVAQKEFIGQYLAAGIKNVEWLPLAFDPQVFYPVEPRGDRCDVLFIGGLEHPMHQRRVVLLDRLKPHCILRVLQCPQDQIRAENAGARIVLNINAVNDLNCRVFETLGTGAFLLTPQVDNNGSEQLFTAGRHFGTYRADELVSQVRHYLSDPDARARIAAAGHACAIDGHTWAHRGRRIVEVAGVLFHSKTCPSRAPSDTLTKLWLRGMVRRHSGLTSAYLAMPEPMKRIACRLTGQTRSSILSRALRSQSEVAPVPSELESSVDGAEA